MPLTKAILAGSMNFHDIKEILIAFAAGITIGACVAVLCQACASEQLHITTQIDAQGRRCYDKADDTAWRERLNDYQKCCENAKK